MKAADVMTTAIVTVQPDTPVHAIAETLLKHGISAVPVIDGAGVPLGNQSAASFPSIAARRS